MGWEVPCLVSRGQGWSWGWLYSELQCTMGNGHMGTPRGETESQKHTTENITFPQLHLQAVIIQ